MKPARVIVLGIAVLAAGAAAMLMSRPAPSPEPVVVERVASVQTTDVLVASADLPIGSTVKPTDLRWQPWPQDFLPAGALTRETLGGGAGEIEGSLVRTGVLAGEPIRREKLVRTNSNAFMSAILPSGMRAVAITIDRTGSTSAGGFVLPNDRVDILKTFREDDGGKGDSQTTETILQGIRILAIGQNIQDRNGEKVVTGDTATIEVTALQAEIVALAQKTGVLSLALRSLADAAEPSDGGQVRAPKDDNSLTLVRYGVTRQASKR